jgi:hypothetical protein
MARLASGKLGQDPGQLDVRQFLESSEKRMSFEKPISSEKPIRLTETTKPTRPSSAAILPGVRLRMRGNEFGPIPVLIDVGATQTVVPEVLLKKFGVPASGVKLASGFDGSTGWFSYYWIDILIPDLSPRFLPVLGGPSLIMLLGRDALMGAVFEFDGANGTYWIHEPGPLRTFLRQLKYRLRKLRDWMKGH